VEFKNVHEASRVWHFVEDSKFTMNYGALEEYFNARAREEGLLSEKFHIHVKDIELGQNKTLNVHTELYKLLEN
jgi:hypothetical protein